MSVKSASRQSGGPKEGATTYVAVDLSVEHATLGLLRTTPRKRRKTLIGLAQPARPPAHSASEGSCGGCGRTTPSRGAGIVLWWLATRSGIASPFGPPHGPGGTGLGVGCGGFGWTTVVPNAGGFCRWRVVSTRPASEGAVSTRVTPNLSSPKRSMTVFARLA